MMRRHCRGAYVAVDPTQKVTRRLATSGSGELRSQETAYRQGTKDLLPTRHPL